MRKRLRINEVDLSYDDEGDGQTVLFVHGGNSDDRIWNDHREIIATQFRMIALTQRYFGLSPWPDDGRNFSIQTHADDLAAFIRALGLEPVAVVGWSYGGAVSLAMSAQHSRLLRGLFLYEPSLATFVHYSVAAGRISDDRVKMLSASKEATNRGDMDAAVQIILEDANDRAGDFQRMPDNVRSMSLQNSRTLPLFFAAPPPPQISCEDLARLDIPVTIAVGENSRAFYRIISRATSQCIPSSRLIEVPNARHLWPIQDPAAFTRLVLDFLNDLPPGLPN